jgi:hypothetical protein
MGEEETERNCAGTLDESLFGPLTMPDPLISLLL